MIAIVCFGAASAQIVLDTLDNRRYYPLELGNERHYTSIAFQTPIPSYLRVRIIDDTSANGKQYFKSRSE